ncbi:MAG TPA: AAA family ATPase [Terriglobales bacterium]|jgi:DNA-binding winged helix-turn-helix (wHTH) protein/tetratricopeptide (TPR) repeat protein|nr:AAA family ATPase [Terriglobales bacterium]
MKTFQSFRLDTGNQCLWRAKDRVPLTPKGFDVLRYLVENPGRLVTVDEVLEALWSETYVNPEVVRKYIREIREVLGDDADNPQYIETFPKRGYQFVAPVTDEIIDTPQGVPSTENLRSIVGREPELSALDGLLDKALVSQRQVIFVTGEAGIGKTTLVDAFHSRTKRIPNLRVARGQCVEGFGGKEAYYPLLEALGRFMRGPEGNAVVETFAKRAPTWLVQFPSLVKSEQREALQREILGATRERMVREICEALEAITTENPLVLVVEDLHWSDPSTLDLISALARQRGLAKLVLLGTYRPADVVLSQNPLKRLKRDLLIHNLCHELPLERLEETDIADYLAAEFPGSNLPPTLAKLIYRHSGGNSLFMVAIVQDMVKKGLIAAHGETWSVTVPLENFAPGVPESLQQLLEVQFDQLAALEQRVLKHASVIGDRFSVCTLSSMLDTESDQVEEACESLAEKQQFIRYAGIREFPDGDTAAQYEFIHSLHRQVLYRRISESNRVRLHKTLGERLAADCASDQPEMASEIALHFELGREYLRAAKYLLITAENATRKFAYRDSVHILEHALRLASRVPSRAAIELEIRILGRMGDAQYTLGDMLESARAFEKEANRAAQAGLRAAQVNALSCLARTTVLIDGDQGLAVCERALQACEGLDNPLIVARTQMLAATLRLGYDEWRQEDAETCALARQTISRLTDPEHPSYQEIWHTNLQSLQGESQAALRTCEAGISRYYEVWDTDRQTLQGEYRDALRTAETGISKVDESTSLVAYVLALSAKTIALLHLGQFGRALEAMRAARARAEKNGNNAWMFILREAWLHTVIFDFEGAQQLCARLVDTNPGYLARHPNAMSLIARGHSALYDGRYEEAAKSFTEVRDRKSTQKFFLHWYWRMQAELGLSNVFLEAGDIANAQREAERFLKSALSTSDPNLQALAWMTKARVAMAQKEWIATEDALLKAFAIVDRFEVPLAAWRVHATAWEFYRQVREADKAEQHRSRAESLILAMAKSLDCDESLKDGFLKASPIQRILDGTELAKTLAAC